MRFKINRKRFSIFLTILVGICTILFWPTDLSKKLENSLINVTKQINELEPLNPIGARLKAVELTKILNEQIYVEYRSSDYEFIKTVNKEEIINHLTLAIVKAKDVKVGLTRYRLISSTSDSAKIAVFLIAEWREASEAELLRAAEDLRIDFKKVENNWLIDKVEALAR